MSAFKLGVNLDHVATVRQARRSTRPDLAEAVAASLRGGADGITLHLRQDRRHVQDADVRRIAPLARLNLEMSATPEMAAIALSVRPHSVCLVPERPQELTTEGGLDAVTHAARLKEVTAELTRAGILVSLFIEPEPRQIAAAAAIGAPFVELHTGAYARDPGEREKSRLLAAATAARAAGVRVNAGHDLDYANVREALALSGLEELNIGFAIVARALFVGLENAVREMKALLAAGPPR